MAWSSSARALRAFSSAGEAGAAGCVCAAAPIASKRKRTTVRIRNRF